MSKAIKVEDQVYDELERLRRKGETFSDVVGDLLGTREKLCGLIDILRDEVRFNEWKLEQLDKQVTIERR